MAVNPRLKLLNSDGAPVIEPVAPPPANVGTDQYVATTTPATIPGLVDGQVNQPHYSDQPADSIYTQTPTTTAGETGLLQAPEIGNTDIMADITKPPEYDPSAVDTPVIDPNTYTDYENTGLIPSAAEDINYLTSQNNPLMAQAETTGLQAANSRGLLNSSMAVGAVEAERLKTIMPLVQQRMENSAQGLLQDDTQRFSGTEAMLDRILTGNLQDDTQDYDAWKTTYAAEWEAVLKQMDIAGREALIDLEMRWNSLIEINSDMSDFWTGTMEGLMDVYEKGTPEQQKAATEYFVGGYTTDENGNETFNPGVLYTTVDWMETLFPK